MCKTDKRILKAKEGEKILVTAKSLKDSDIDTINSFIKFGRDYSKLQDIKDDKTKIVEKQKLIKKLLKNGRKK
jgi:TusA-related sulfurtransferase